MADIHLLTASFFLLCSKGLSETQAILDVGITRRNTGAVEPYCMATFPVGYSQPTIKWEITGRQLSVNGTWTGTTTYETQVFYTMISNQERTFLSYFLIYEAMKSDEGNYTCLATYYIGDIQHVDEVNIFVEISKYLPPVDYPKCSVSPSTKIENAVTFRCDPGYSNPPVSLVLLLQRSDGMEEQLGNVPNITKQITLDDIHSHFVCRMTSDYFKTAKRQCSIGPIGLSSLSQNGIKDASNLQETTTLTFTLGITLGPIIGIVLASAIFSILLFLMKKRYANEL